MAERPAPKPASVSDWQDVGDWQDVNAGGKAAPETPKPEGFLHSLGSQFGTTPEEGTQEKPHSLLQGLGRVAEDAAGPFAAPIEGAYRSGKELLGAGKSLAHGDVPGAELHAVRSIPIVGPAEEKMARQSTDEDYGGALGTGIGAAVQAGLGLEGGLRGLGEEPHFIPSAKRAGKVFESLKTDLANQPVPLQSARAPLAEVQRIHDLLGGAPTPAQSLMKAGNTPMNYPDIRLIQEGLSNVSRNEAGNMTGSMRGGVKQLNKGLFEDIERAAGDRGPEYKGAMNETRRANQLKNVMKWATPIAAGAAGARQGYQAYKTLP